MKKSWKEKLNNSKGLPKVEIIKGNLINKWGKGTVVIPSPQEVNEIMKKVPKGKLLTINNIRNILAKRHKATIACPITTGIFVWISAHAAEEELKSGKKRVTPYWRTLKSNGELNQKYPEGIRHQKELLEAEGHNVILKGKKMVVEDYVNKIIHK